TFPHFVTTTDVSGHTHLHRVARDVPLLVSLFPFVANALYTVPLIAVRGQTIGQRALKLRVVRVQDLARGADAPPPGLDVSVRRFLLPAAAGLIGLVRSIAPAVATLVQIPIILDLLWALWDSNRQCLHDK